jgi:hypothetical protein
LYFSISRIWKCIMSPAPLNIRTPASIVLLPLPLGLSYKLFVVNSCSIYSI